MKDFLKEVSYNRILTVVFILLLTYLVLKIGAALLKKLSEKYAQKRIQIKSLIPIYKLVIYLVSIFFILFGVFKISGQSLTAFGLSLGVALGFAFQDILGNLFGGLLIIFTKPFAIGDKIKIGEHYGEVLDISLRRIELVTSDDNTISVPNKSILTEHISNANSGELNCQVVTEFYIPINSDLKKMKKLALEVAYSSPYVYLKKPVSVVFKHHYVEDLVLLMKIKAYVFDHRYEFALSSDITLRLQKILNEDVKK